jgi:DNA-binding transcriptional MerR regulator
MKEIDLKQLTKLYYSIGEIAKMFDVNTSLIRFWESEFKEIQPKKNKRGIRVFTPKDIETFNKIYNLIKIQGFTIDGAKKELKEKVESVKSNPTNESNHSEIIGKLERIKSKLIQLKNN